MNVGQQQVVVVGSGFSGSIMARKLAEERGKRVLLLEQRPHIGGNMYDEIDGNGVLVQMYGPHFLNTNHYWIIGFLSRYAELFEHTTKLLSYIDGKYVRLPFNFQTLQQLVTPARSERLIGKMRDAFPGRDRVTIYELLEQGDEDIAAYGTLLYEKAYKTYVAKQWGLSPDGLDRSVFERVQMALGYDERYLNKDFQYLPKAGFTKLFERMLDHPNIEVRLRTNALEKLEFDGGRVRYGGETPECLIYTGAIDELFSERYGRLPYRSLEFKTEVAKGGFMLPCEIVSYPQAEGYTRKTEYKQFNTFVPDTPYTTVVTEYPLAYDKEAAVGNLPYYPVVNSANTAMYERYRLDAQRYKNLFLCGRLAEYKYFNMDVVIEHTFEEYRRVERYLDAGC